MEILQRARLLASCMVAGSLSFMLLGYLAKLIPALFLGVLAIFAIANLFAIYLFVCYPSLREEVGAGLVSEAIAVLLLII